MQDASIIQQSYSNKRVKSIVVAAHFDDVEFMAYSAIAHSISSEDGIAAVIVTNGGNSPRTGKYADTSDQDMVQLRIQEQLHAAQLAQYSKTTMLMYPSWVVKDCSPQLIQQLADIISDDPDVVVYTHNPFDKHPTHVAVCKAVVAAIKSLPSLSRPKRLIGCEVWRGLDWMLDQYKIPMDTSDNHDFAKALFGVFESQIQGGKNYGNAVIGRWISNATFYDSHGVDKYTSLSYGVDMTPLATEQDMTLAQFAKRYLDDFANSVLDSLK
ncbi:MAG: PIG-L family deacetylase [Clostridiales bacterium]|jgi:LmbE family N-acetylglucosaminyl deacetylase|nr:PIG-L family deacetylase [Clostridiales bacterium]